MLRSMFPIFCSQELFTAYSSEEDQQHFGLVDVAQLANNSSTSLAQ